MGIKRKAKANLSSRRSSGTAIMEGTDFIEIPQPLGDLISDAITRFAEEQGLEFDLWHHDQPIWLLWKKSRGMFFRQVQVSAFSDTEGQKLYFIPSVCRFKDEKLSTVSDDDVTKKTIAIPLSALLDPKATNKYISQRIRDGIEAAWKAAQTFLEKNMRAV